MSQNFVVKQERCRVPISALTSEGFPAYATYFVHRGICWRTAVVNVPTKRSLEIVGSLYAANARKQGVSQRHS